MMLKSIRNRKWGLAGAAALLWLLICLLVTPVYTTVTLTYAEDPSGEVITTVFAGPGENVSASDAKSRVVNSGVARISWLDLKYGNHCSLKRIDPVDQAYSGGELTVDSLTVRKNGIVVISLEGEELKEYFTGNEQVSFSDTDTFTFSVTGEDPQLLPTAELYTGKPPGIPFGLARIRPSYPASGAAGTLGADSGAGRLPACENYLPSVSGRRTGRCADGRLHGSAQSLLAESGRV